RALPAVLQADGGLHGGRAGRPVARARRAAGAGARSGRFTVVRGLVRSGGPGGLLADRRRQRLSAGGVRGVRPEHPPRTAAVGGAGLPASGAAAPEPEAADVDADDAGGVLG